MVAKIMFTTVVAVSVMLSSCSVKNICSGKCHDTFVSDTVTVKNFDAIAGSATEIIYVTGSERKVIYSACEQIADDVKIYVKKNKLIIDIDDSRKNHELKCIVTGPKYISRIDIAGACHFKSSDDISSEDLEIHCSGASAVQLTGKTYIEDLEIHCSGASNVSISNLEGEDLESHASGASIISLSGAMKTAEYYTSGTSRVMVENLQTKLMKADVSGASILNGAAENVRKRVSGSSTINVKEL